MTTLDQIDKLLTSTFSTPSIADVALNGIQIEGAAEVRRIAVAVDAGLSTIQAAAALQAELLFVHHGIYWGRAVAIRGADKALVAECLHNNLTLYALHLPLDAHSEFGNSAQLCNYLQLEAVAPTAEYHGTACGVLAENRKGWTLDQLRAQLATLDGALPEFCALPFGPRVPQRICIVTGSGCDQLMQSHSEQFDTLITGEPRQFAYHYCKLHGLNALFPGHYASETLGVKAVGSLLLEQLGLPWDYISEPTGI